MLDMAIRWPLEHHRPVLERQSILDLACHNGKSSLMMLDLGASKVTGVDIRTELISQAQSVNDPRLEFICHDITDQAWLTEHVPLCTVITAFGVLYHLHDHFKFMKNIMCKNVRHVIFETLYGPETNMPAMFWNVEDTCVYTNGWDADLAQIMHGTPNLSWLLTAADIFNFGCDYIHRRYVSKNWNNTQDDEKNKRMVVRFFNRAIISKTSFLPEDVWRWTDDNLIHEVK